MDLPDSHPPVRETSRAARDTALARILEARADFAALVDERYASGARLAARGSDGLEEIARRIVIMVDELEGPFARLHVARDLCTYLGPEGARVHRAAWDRKAIAEAVAEAFDAFLQPPACRVLAAAARVETMD